MPLGPLRPRRARRPGSTPAGATRWRPSGGPAGATPRRCSSTSGAAGCRRQGAWRIVRAPRRRGPASGDRLTPARAAPLVRHPHARPRRRHPGRAGAARPRLDQHHADLHAGVDRAAAQVYDAAHPRATGRPARTNVARVTDASIGADAPTTSSRARASRASASSSRPRSASCTSTTWPRPRTSNFADSGQVAAEQGEIMALATDLRDQLDDVERALAKLDAGTYGQCEVCGEPIADARLEAMPATRFCIAARRLTAASMAGVAPPRHALLRLAAARAARRATDAEWAEAQLLPGEVELWRRMSRADRRHAAGRGPPGRGALGRRGHPPGAGRRAAARRRQDRGRPRHLRPGHRHAVGRGRRPRPGHRPGLDPHHAASPAGSGSTCSTRSSAATCSAWPAAIRSPWPGPASTTCPRTEWTDPDLDDRPRPSRPPTTTDA